MKNRTIAYLLCGDIIARSFFDERYVCDFAYNAGVKAGEFTRNIIRTVMDFDNAAMFITVVCLAGIISEIIFYRRIRKSDMRFKKEAMECLKNENSDNEKRVKVIMGQTLGPSVPPWHQLK